MTTQQIAMNVTNSASSFMSNASLGWVITLLVFMIIVITLSLISRNFKMTILGAITTGILYGILYGIYNLSRYVGKSAEEGDTSPLITMGFMIGFIIVSFIVGKLLYMYKPIMEFMEFMESGWSGEEVSK